MHNFTYEVDYDPNTRIITSPGKFEGEMIYVPYLWDLALQDGEPVGDEDWNGLELTLTDEDKRAFPQLAEWKRSILSEDNNGFVTCSLWKA